MREITRSVKVALKCLIAVVLVDVDLPYWTSKVEDLVAFPATVSNICTAHVQKRLFMHFRCKFRHRRLIRRPRFPVRVQNFGDNPHQVWSWYDHTLPSYSVFVWWYITWLCDFDFWPFVLEELLCMAGHVTNLATKLEDPMSIRSWFMSHNVSRWLPLRMRTRPLRMRRITWPVSRGQKQLHFWNPRPWFAYSLCIFGGSTMNVVKVICKNNARPCVKRRMSFCACEKSRDLLKVT